jgi:hypothetical protein
MKRNLILLSKFIISLVGLGLWSILLTIIMFPYQILRVFLPQSRPKRSKGNRVSGWFRRVFEHQQTRKFIGASLTMIILFVGVMDNILAATELESEVVMISSPSTEVLTETSLVKPLEGRIGQNYHGFHRALDILAPIGTEIRPIAEGRVTEVSMGRLGWGNTVVIEHENGLRSRYAHLRDIKVIEGEEIETNFVLGTVGMTGWTTGPHLHLEIHQRGKAIDPLMILPSFESISLALAR